MAQASDWTERHRPRSEQLLEGNEVQRRKIRAWLDEWQNGAPKKKAVLLIGPPGVGKTTVARAIAEDMGWNVIELNASDARNAAAIRKAATSGATHRSLFHDPTAPPSRTLILLDEVDHLSGGLRQVSQERIERAMEGDDEKPGSSLRGDSGGKAELLRLLEQTKQPVMLACNEEMGLWGRNSSWRTTRDRFGRHLLKINFVRASDEALRRIARRVLREENVAFEDSAIDALASTNHGDLRALVRDLQVMATGLDGETLTADMVRAHAQASQRDVTVEIFPGLDRLYRERTSAEASQLIRTIDKDASDFLNWVHWNNASLFTHAPSVHVAASRPGHDGTVSQHRPPFDLLDSTPHGACSIHRQRRAVGGAHFPILSALPTAQFAGGSWKHRGKTRRALRNQQSDHEGGIPSPTVHDHPRRQPPWRFNPVRCFP